MTDLTERLRFALAGRYEPVREIGRGGMAVVVLARDCRHPRSVAIKILLPELAAALGPDRFLREIQIEAGLQHPHILPLYDSGVADGLLYYVMPYVEGESLRQRLDRDRQLPIAEALQITSEVAEALAYAHRQGIVHRDVKPANILLSDGHALVADFGVARAISAAGQDRITATGLAVGTPAYMSPEQASGEIHVDGRSDLYALACVLYEMLVGEPPFSGANPRAIAARHLHDTPPSLRVVRPSIPTQIERAVATALSKVPADRFASVTDFVGALSRLEPEARWNRAGADRSLRWWLAGAGLLAALAGFGAWRLMDTPVDLDPRRVVIFPLESPGGEDQGQEGEAVATYIGYALEASEPLRWLEGAERLDAPGRGSRAPTLEEASAISRKARAGFFIDGLIVRAPDSIRVVLRLHDVAGDSIVVRTGAAGDPATASLPQLGLEAVGALLPSLLEPGRTVDMSPLSERRPAAVAHFLQGEREYRESHFDAALVHFAAATREDSAFALAALKGSQAAGWLGRDAEQERLAALAAVNESLLPHRYRPLARAQWSYASGRADSAVADLERALASDSAWSEAWMALGEVYYHLLPSRTPLDSLAEDAFVRSREADPEFTPPLFHLTEIALRGGDIERGDRLLAEFQRTAPDSTRNAQLMLMAGCVRETSDSAVWQRAAGTTPAATLEAAKALSGTAAQPRCAEQGFRAVVFADSLAENLRWGALLGLQSLLVAQARTADVTSLLESEAGLALGGLVLYLLDAASGAPLGQRAEAVAKREGEDYARMGGPLLWLLGTWAASEGDVDGVSSIVHALVAKRDSSRGRRDQLLVDAMEARLILLRGDTAEALARLDALRPNAPRADLAWQPWESLGAERLALAELLLELGRHEAAASVAAVFDSPQPVVSLIYLPASLRIRERAALALGHRGSADHFRRRREQVQAGRPISQSMPFTFAPGGSDATPAANSGRAARVPQGVPERGPGDVPGSEGLGDRMADVGRACPAGDQVSASGGLCPGTQAVLQRATRYCRRIGLRREWTGQRRLPAAGPNRPAAEAAVQVRSRIAGERVPPAGTPTGAGRRYRLDMPRGSGTG